MNDTKGEILALLKGTAKAHGEAFPDRSDRLVELLIKEIGYLDASELQGLSERQRTLLLLERLAERLANEYAAVIQGWPLQERVVFVTEVMQSDGGFAEWEKTERGFEIRDFNCLFHRLLDGDACEWHSTFLKSVLGEDLQVEPFTTDENCCSYAVEAKVPANAGFGT